MAGKLKFKSLFFALFTSLCLLLPACAEINKDLFLRCGSVYVLSFEENVVKYSTDNPKALKVELPVNLAGTKNEIIIKPLNGEKTKLSVWTGSQLYNYTITVYKPDFSPYQEDLTSENFDDKSDLPEIEIGRAHV